jgi:hypothetical protein
MFSSHTRSEVEVGAKVRFWHDMWYGGKAHKEAFPDLYGIAYAKDTSVAALLELFGGSNKWKATFARVAHDWEVDVFASFFNLSYSIRMVEY